VVYPWFLIFILYILSLFARSLGFGGDDSLPVLSALMTVSLRFPSGVLLLENMT
jgi:hypothetical protein